MFRSEMPRIYELQNLIVDRSACDAYFQNFDTSVRDEPEKKKLWLERERAFQRLDSEAWEFLKDEARPYLTRPNSNGRGYQQLISFLNQAWAYNYLLDIGCRQVEFIPSGLTNKQETPDLKGKLGERTVLCEVKSLGISDDEAERRKTHSAGSIVTKLHCGFFNKLTYTLLKAGSQMKTYDATAGVKRIAFLAIDFDDLLGEYKEDYYAQIDGHLAVNLVNDVHVVFYNSRTAFHRPFSMNYAEVIHEPAG